MPALPLATGFCRRTQFGATLSFEITPILMLKRDFPPHEFNLQATTAKGQLQGLVHIAEKFQKFGKVHTVIGHHSQVKEHMESSIT
jgi:hypothetical protein